MTDRSVSDLVFRDFDPRGAVQRSDEERRATMRDELDKLRRRRSGPRVIPVARPAMSDGERR